MTIEWGSLSSLERDRLIHEKVFGNPAICIGKLLVDKKDTPSRAGGIAWSHYQATCTNCAFARGYMDKDAIPEQHAPMEDIPPYSTDMNAAWQIVTSHKFMEVQLEYGESWISETEQSQTYLCIVSPYTGPWTISADGQSMQEAICIASLKAVGVEIEA